MDWLRERWPDIAIPAAVFLAWLFGSLWVRRAVYRAFARWARRTRWQGDDIVVRATRGPFLFWSLLLGTYISLQVSALDPEAIALAGKVAASLFAASLTLAAASVADQLLRLHLAGVSGLPLGMVANVARASVLALGVLVLLDLWGAPTTPIVLVLLAVGLAAIVASRDALPNLMAGLQVSTGGHVKEGDYIKLESGEEGYVTAMTWRHIQVSAPDGSRLFIPNSRLARSTVINYGRPLKTAREPFRFHTRFHLKELTGWRASTLRELVDLLRQAPDSVAYYHTHHFLEEHHYLTPEPPNDFAAWVSDALGEEVLGERLASVDTMAFPALGALRARLVSIMEEHLAAGGDSRRALEGREFHFVKSVSLIAPTPYVAHDLREFIEALRKVSTGTIYYHIFEARLRLQKGENDFSAWMEESLDEEDLARAINGLDPYTHTLEGLRSAIIQLIEKHIK